MKPLFRCDYCNFTGTEKEVKEHEAECIHNYTLRSCLTCKHKKSKSLYVLDCARGENIPENVILKIVMNMKMQRM